jgi:hypothetical protein
MRRVESQRSQAGETVVTPCQLYGIAQIEIACHHTEQTTNANDFVTRRSGTSSNFRPLSVQYGTNWFAKQAYA